MSLHQIDDQLPEDEPSPWMTIEEAARYLRKTEHTIHAYARQGMIKKHRVVGLKTVLVSREEIEQLVVPTE